MVTFCYREATFGWGGTIHYSDYGEIVFQERIVNQYIWYGSMIQADVNLHISPR